MKKSNKKHSKKTLLDNDEMIDAIEQGHNSLGTDITDIYQKINDLLLQQESAISYVKERFMRYAKLAGKLSAFLFEINSRESLDALSKEELNLLDHVREMLQLATLIQRKINEDILKRLRTLNIETRDLSEANNELVDQIMSVQDKSRVLVFMIKSMQNSKDKWYTNMLTSSVDILKSNEKSN
jgi:hypothetical protein